MIPAEDSYCDPSTVCDSKRRDLSDLPRKQVAIDLVDPSKQGELLSPPRRFSPNRAASRPYFTNIGQNQTMAVIDSMIVITLVA